MKSSKTHSDNGKTLYISSLVVSPNYQRKGIGPLIFKEIYEIAKKHECKEIALVANIKEKHIVPFYKKLGFLEIRIIGFVEYEQISDYAYMKKQIS